MFTKGQTVEVTFDDGHKELGRVVYQRMAAPDYNRTEAVSVFLDSKRNQPNYVGTMFFANNVRPM